MGKIIIRKKFLAEHLEKVKGVFRSFDLSEGVFRAPDFHVVFLPEDHFYDPSEGSALSSAIRTVGDENIVMTNVEAIPIHSESLILSADKDFWREAERETETNVPVFSQAMFGLSGRWGVLVDKHYECRIIGGESIFLNCFIKELGCLETLNSRFLRYIDKAWMIPQEEKEHILKVNGWK